VGSESKLVPDSDERSRRTLRGLEDIRPLYILPRDPFAEEVLVPAFTASSTVDCMVGFFASQVLACLAPGLASYIARSPNTFRLIISPLLRAEDRAAIAEGTSAAAISAAVENLIITEDALQQHTLRCLSWLLRAGRIEIKVAVLQDALFHPKVWLFRDGADLLAAHGSSNVTYAGIHKNIEQVAISRSWLDPTQQYTAKKLSEQFTRFWNDKEDDCIVLPIPDAIRDRIVQTYKQEFPPTEDDFRALYKRAGRSRTYTDEPVVVSCTASFSIPSGLKFEEGPFEHQGQAVKAWCGAGCQGVLEMATGSGKTITAMICAHRLYEERKPLLIVVAAPYLPLVQQWCDEIVAFGLQPFNLTLDDASGRAAKLSRIRRRLRGGTSQVEVLVVSHRTLCSAPFKEDLQRFESLTTLLIADEVHNLGAEGFISDPPSFFSYKLGLSATPIRQYDDEGTEALFAFFGPIVFRFTLQEAIGRCLVEYDYYVHPVELTHGEMNNWYDLTAKIKANAWRIEDGKADEYLAKLFRDRRLLLETAENKISALETALGHEDLRTLRHTLIYASDKAPEQLDAVNRLLNRLHLLFHQLTSEETANREETARIIKSFQEGTLRALTAKRVLDEGVNIPQIKKAFVLASTTVERQWVQRRGRLLRTCREIAKTHSVIHDFVVIPPDLEHLDHDARSLLRSELLRVQEFASLARNAGRADGPLPIIDQMVNSIYS
jgi:superfamily II DNA or RNA helicase